MRILHEWKVKVTYVPALQSEMVSMLAKYVPGGVWTPAARVAALSKLTGETRYGTILASILVEAVLSAVSGVVVFVASLAWVHDVDAPLAPLIVFALFCLALVHPRIFGPLMRRLTRPFGLAPIEPLSFSLMGRLLVFYCGTWLIGGLALYFLIRGVGGSAPLSSIPFLAGTAAIGAIVAVLVVFAPGGLGVREASMYGLLTTVTTQRGRARRDAAQPDRDHLGRARALRGRRRDVAHPAPRRLAHARTRARARSPRARPTRPSPRDRRAGSRRPARSAGSAGRARSGSILRRSCETFTCSRFDASP